MYRYAATSTSTVASTLVVSRDSSSAMMIGELMDVTRLVGVGWLVGWLVCQLVRAVNPHNNNNTIKAVNAKDKQQKQEHYKRRWGGRQCTRVADVGVRVADVAGKILAKYQTSWFPR